MKKDIFIDEMMNRLIIYDNELPETKKSPEIFVE
jgi:hypothetical protein